MPLERAPHGAPRGPAASGYTLVRWPANPSPPATGEPASPRAAASAGQDERERFGPLAIERRVKDDGRALILYTRDTRGATAMSELRFNELRGEEVVYAIHRQERTFLPRARALPAVPHAARRAEPTEIPVRGFEIAVFDNRFPAFEAPQRRGRGGRLHRRPRRLASARSRPSAPRR